VGSPPLLCRAPASPRGFVVLLVVPVALAVAGLVVVATLHRPTTAVGPHPDQAAVLRAHLAAAPDDAGAWAELGTLALQQAAHTGDPRHYPDADAALGRSLLLRPNENVAALNGLAALRTTQHRYGEAQDLARRALAVDPQSGAAWATLADAASGLGLRDEARDAVARMLDRRSDVAALTRSAALDELGGRVDAARATLERAVGTAVSPAETAHVHAALADLAFAGGDPLEAQRQIRLARTADPDDPDLVAGQAAAEAAVGMIPAALADYSSVVDSAAVADSARATAGAPATVGTAGGDHDGRRLVAPRHLVAAGELFEAAGRPAEGRRAYDRFGAMSALYAANGVPLATEPALFAADRGDAAQALRLADAGLRVGPTPAAQDAFAWALAASGRDAEALIWAERATSTGMHNALFAFHKGMIESSLGRDVAAQADLAMALRTNPWFSPRLAPLARVALTALSGSQ
jgi:tetratricopeptide (TPR) repeat protein